MNDPMNVGETIILIAFSYSISCKKYSIFKRRLLREKKERIKREV